MCRLSVAACPLAACYPCLVSLVSLESAAQAFFGSAQPFVALIDGSGGGVDRRE